MEQLHSSPPRIQALTRHSIYLTPFSGASEEVAGGVLCLWFVQGTG